MSQWRVSDMALCLLTALAVMAAWEGYSLNHRPETSGCGGDFSQFYTAGTIIARGEAARLYDQYYFKHFQTWMREDPLRSLYPPTMGLAMSPLSRLPYTAALAAWWAIQFACLAMCGIIFYRTTPLVARVADQRACGPGGAAAALDRHRHRPSGAPASAGVNWRIDFTPPRPANYGGRSVGALGSQAATRRRAVRVDAAPPRLANVGRPGAWARAVQFVVVAAALGPAIWLDYLRELPKIAAMTARIHLLAFVRAIVRGHRVQPFRRGRADGDENTGNAGCLCDHDGRRGVIALPRRCSAASVWSEAAAAPPTPRRRTMSMLAACCL